MSDTQASAGGKSEDAPKKVWNSLEISKLAVGAMTPLVVAGLGVFLTLGAEFRSDERTKAAERRSQTREIAAEKRAEGREVRAKVRDEKFALGAEEREAKRAAAALAASHALTRQMADLAADREKLFRDQEAVRQAANRRIERRSRIWDDLGPQFNDIYIFIMRAGRYKELSALEILQAKRNADRTLNNYKPFFTPRFVNAYENFMLASFQTCVGEGLDAQIRTTGYGRQDPDDPRYGIRFPEPPKHLLVPDPRVIEEENRIRKEAERQLERDVAQALSLAYVDLMGAAAADLGLGNAESGPSAPIAPIAPQLSTDRVAAIERYSRGICDDRAELTRRIEMQAPTLMPAHRE